MVLFFLIYTCGWEYLFWSRIDGAFVRLLKFRLTLALPRNKNESY